MDKRAFFSLLVLIQVVYICSLALIVKNKIQIRDMKNEISAIKTTMTAISEALTIPSEPAKTNAVEVLDNGI